MITAAHTWVWTPDTTIALVGVVVAGLGAVATTLIALFALQQTRRANQLEQRARARAERAALSTAVDAYLSGWVPVGLPGGVERLNREHIATADLRAVAAGVSREASDVVSWVLAALIEGDATGMMPKPLSGVGRDEMRRLLGFALRLQARRRVTDWVLTGTLDRSPLPGLVDGEPTEADAGFAVSG